MNFSLAGLLSEGKAAEPHDWDRHEERKEDKHFPVAAVIRWAGQQPSDPPEGLGAADRRLHRVRRSGLWRDSAARAGS